MVLVMAMDERGARIVGDENDPASFDSARDLRMRALTS